jgi:hypothetical protein
MKRTPGMNQGRPKMYTPDERQRRQREQRQVAEARHRANPRTCSAARCAAPAVFRSDYCSPHAVRVAKYGHPHGGPIAGPDWRSMLTRVRVRLRPRLDPELHRLALEAVERLVVAPVVNMTDRPVPRARRGHRLQQVAESRLLVELHRLQHPAKLKVVQRDRKGNERRRREQPVTPQEALDAAVTAWAIARLPGGVTRGRFADDRLPILDSERCLQMAIGRAVLLLRRTPVGTRLNLVAVRLLGEQVISELSPMMPYVLATLQKIIAKGAKQNLAKLAKKLKVIATAPPPTPTANTKLVFEF